MIMGHGYFGPRNTRKARKEEKPHGAAISRSPTPFAPQAPFSIGNGTAVGAALDRKWRLRRDLRRRPGDRRSAGVSSLRALLGSDHEPIKQPVHFAPRFGIELKPNRPA